MKTYDGHRSKVLMVDDKVENLILLKTMLEPMNLEFYIAQNGEEALERINENDFDLILLDIVMPGIDGYAVCRIIKQNKKKRDTPVLFLSALHSREDKIKGFESGADDYLVKPLYQLEVVARVQLHLQKRAALKRLQQLLRRSYHELYNPLAIIETSAQMYDVYNAPNKYVDAMHAAAKSLHVIYEDLYYALSPAQSEKVAQKVDLTLFVHERLSFFSLLADIRGITFQLDLPKSMVVFIPDADLQRIVDNTLSNAIKYAFEKSEITITLACDQGVVLNISNQGSEIRDPEQIFTEGYREAYEQSGMGIGLEIVASICHQHEIRTSVVSRNNTTTFTYIFPDGA
ncbi:MAG: response regulator [Campylobacterota bacterium]|nr:response regulator [Campylobacterota bacterium]